MVRDFILIGNGSDSNTEKLINILHEDGFKVKVEKTGEEVLKTAHEESPSLILLDIEMPVLDGFETCQKLKSKSQTESIPVIFITGLEDIKSKQDALAVGGADYINKPFQKSEVLSRIKTRLSIERYRNFLEKEVKKRTKEIEVVNVKLRSINEELKLTNKQLELEILKTRQAEDALIQSQKMETIGILAAGLAHDFNNALTGISGVASIIKYKVSKNIQIDSKDLLNYTDIIMHSTLRASSMVVQLLSVSKKQEVILEPVDVRQIIKNVEKIIRNSFDKSIEIKVSNFKESAFVNADLSQIEQVILNICVNAAHAMTIMRKKSDRQGGVLSISIKKVAAGKYFCMRYPEAQEIEYIVISVKDNGVGMTKKTIEKIFTPFFTTKSEHSGTGLGLAMSYNIVKQHNGIIDVYSETERGTKFDIYLPSITKEDGKVKELSGVCSDVPCGSGYIMVIDDEEVVRQIAKEILQDCGYKVISVESGKKAINFFKSNYDKIKAVLLDTSMPGVSGKETFSAIRKIDPSAKIIIGSGFRYDEKIQEILDLGAQGFIQKPYTFRELGTKIGQIIDKKNI